MTTGRGSSRRLSAAPGILASPAASQAIGELLIWRQATPRPRAEESPKTRGSKAMRCTGTEREREAS
eukprot:scaffold6858_cov112-Isochrysis_galbana.AAC.2